MRTRMEGLAKKLRLPRNNQRGFTLIEMLVVISILGILAAVVTISMVNVIGRAQTQANSTEQHTVQVALDAMLSDSPDAAGNPLTPAAAGCTGGGGTKSMAAFPSGSHPLYPNYLHQATTRQGYTCDAATGQVIPG